MMYDINSVFSIDIGRLTTILISHSRRIVKSFFLRTAVTLKHLGHGTVVITSHLLVGHPAVLLGSFDTGMAQKVLDGDKIRISIEHLSGHSVAQLMARYL